MENVRNAQIKRKYLFLKSIVYISINGMNIAFSIPKLPMFVNVGSIIGLAK